MNPRQKPTTPSDLRWPASDVILPPAPGAVAVWCALLQCDTRQLVEPGPPLSLDEQARALKFLSEELRQRYVASRVIVRRILGACLGVAPERVPMRSDAKGKPHLAGDCGVQFNLAHSSDLLVVAVAQGLPVGVDVERVRPLNDAPSIARRFFTRSEADWLEAQEGADGDRSFFRLWTRKEAALKATGEGISSGLNSIELLDDAGAFKNTVVRNAGDAAQTVWTLRELEPARGFVGALAWPAGTGPVDVLLRRTR